MKACVKPEEWFEEERMSIVTRDPAPLDLWIARDLKRRYTLGSGEPLPDAIARLVALYD
jgi:hypothetical protein